MKKHLTTQRIVGYLIYLLLACSLVFGVTYARYVTSVSGTATAKTASMEMNMNTQMDLSGLLKGLKPGGKKEIKFEVRNFEAPPSAGGDNKISEVGQEYSVTVKTTGNLPLTYTLDPDTASGKVDGTYVGAAPESVGASLNPAKEWVWRGGVLPYSASGTSHAYILTVAWPEGQADSAYKDEIDLVTLTVDAMQVQPEAAK